MRSIARQSSTVVGAKENRWPTVLFVFTLADYQTY